MYETKLIVNFWRYEPMIITVYQAFLSPIHGNAGLQLGIKRGYSVMLGTQRTALQSLFRYELSHPPAQISARQAFKSLKRRLNADVQVLRINMDDG